MVNNSLDLMIRMDLINEKVKLLIENRLNNIITELALPRKGVKERISNTLPQIIQNWCLIKYSLTNNINNKLIKHWKSELITHLNNVTRLQIKGNDSFDNRKILINQIINEEDLTDVAIIDLIISNKFIQENINISSKEYGNVLIDFINNINHIVDLIALKNRDKILEYVNNI